MNQLLIKAATEADLPALEKLWSYCFNDGERFRNWYFSEYYQREECLIANVDGVPTASLQIIDLPMRAKNKSVRAGYIVGVDCLPEYRGLGLTRRLMQEAILKYAPAHDIELLHLMPFEADFYEPYGFVFSDYHFDMALDIAEFYSRENGDVAHAYHWRNISVEEISVSLALLEKIYETATAHYDAAIERKGMRRWRAFLCDLDMEGGYFKLLLDDREDVAGYLAYIIKEDAFYVREALARDASARKAIYYFIAAHRSQVKMVEWSAPEDEKIVFCRKKDKDGVRFRPFMMSLILSPKILPFFTERRPRQDIYFRIEKENYCWQAETEQIVKSGDYAEALVLDHKILTKMVFDRAWAVPQNRSELIPLAELFTNKVTFFNNEYF